MADPIACNLYEVEFTSSFTIRVAAPMNMSMGEVCKLIEIEKKNILHEEEGRYDWTSAVQTTDVGDASDTDRYTWIVNDERSDLVRGEETTWLPDPGHDSVAAEEG